MSIYQKLNTARKKFHALPLKKSGHNKFAGYYYFELGDFLIPAMQVLDEVALCAIVSFTGDTATMRIIDIETDKEIIITSPMGSAALKGCHEVQNIGAVETYQRRYLWVAALEIVEHDALDASAGSEKIGPAPISAKPITRDVFDHLDTDTQDYLRSESMHVIGYLAKGNAAEALAYLESLHLDADLKTGMWSLFDSKQRTAMTAVTTRKAA